MPTLAEQGLDPELVAELYFNAADGENIEGLLAVENSKLNAEALQAVLMRIPGNWR